MNSIIPIQIPYKFCVNPYKENLFPKSSMNQTKYSPHMFQINLIIPIFNDKYIASMTTGWQPGGTPMTEKHAETAMFFQNGDGYTMYKLLV